MVRPWALCAPILVLLICLPLMRPLRHPDPTQVSDDEQARLATIQAIVEQHTLAIERTSFRATRCLIVRPNGHWYSSHSPVMSAMLSGPYWVMHRCGLTLDDDPVLAEYLLTLLGVTLPVAFAAGLLYRMGRLFELRRPLRAALALGVVVGSGWISYATVLSAGPAAAALVVMGMACLVQATLSRKPAGSLLWTALAGLCVALAATYQLTAIVFLLLLIVPIFAFRWPVSRRVGGIALYAAGAAIPLLLYAGLNRATTGDLRPGFLHAELRPEFASSLSISSAAELTRGFDEDESFTHWQEFTQGTARFFTALFGSHGPLTHFPVLLFGIWGMTMIMHRHWPATTKILACASILGGLVIIVGYTAARQEWKDEMFANRWFVVFLPLMLFWSGAWLRRPHTTAAWVAMAVLLSFSTFVGIIGATDPQPQKGYQGYTLVEAIDHLMHPQPSQPVRTNLASQGY